MQFQQMPRKPEEGAVHDQVMAWIRSGQLKLADFVSDRIPFDHITDAFDLVSEHRDSTKKIVISYPR
jgi:threonine dehydrogenase-like Zn-dependent dehydrogenase